MKRILSERFVTYAANEKWPSTARITIKMCDAIDQTLMQDALAATQQRYPYFCVRFRITNGDDGREYFALEDNPQPWVMQPTCKPVCLMGSESNDHLLAFACWDDSFAIDFFHGLTDGAGTYHVLRTLTYEYCRRRYDSQLSREGVRVAGDDISPEEWTDPASLPRPENLKPIPVPAMARPLNLRKEAAVPHRDGVESVFIQIDEKQVMEYVAAHGTTPATLLSLLLARAVGRLHPDVGDAAPSVALAINQRPALGTPQACQSLMSGINLLLNNEVRHLSIDEQLTAFRSQIVTQLNPDNVLADFYGFKERMDQLDMLPTIAARRQAMAALGDMADIMGTCGLSYVGKANFGAAERYIREMFAEVSSPFELLFEVSAISGKFDITVLYHFATDDYLDAFIDEARQIGLSAVIVSRRPLQIAPIAAFYITD